MRIVALLLIVLGIVGLILGVIGYNRQTTIIEIGDLKATATEHKTIPFAPIAGAISILGGAALLIIEKRRA